MSYINIDLKLQNGKNLQYNDTYINTIKGEIVSFLDSEKYMDNLRFAKRMMMSQEIKSNNSIEGINDDLTLIDQVIKSKKYLSTDDRNRIINLYHGYQYILTHKSINKDSLRELYSILSKDLLDSKYINNMGDYYRNGPVYLYDRDRVDAYPYRGVDSNLLDNYMNNLFEYIDCSNSYSDNKIDYFIKSQIMHFYFVYIHPYFDINGRTSRTVAMWYLLNNKSYPYIIFNRAIAFNQRGYEPAIIETKKYGNITNFLKYILDNVRHEFEKEYVVHTIEKSSSCNLTKDNLQTLEYILTMNGNVTALDFITLYNRLNDKRKPSVIIEEKLNPLIDKNIIIPTKTTKNTNSILNYQFLINEKLTKDINIEKIKTLNLDKYTKKTL